MSPRATWRVELQIALAAHGGRGVRDREAAQVQGDRAQRGRRERHVQAREVPDLQVPREGRRDADRGAAGLAPERVERDVHLAAGRCAQPLAQVRSAVELHDARRRRVAQAVRGARSRARRRRRAPRRAPSPPARRRCRTRRSRRARAPSRPGAGRPATTAPATRRGRCSRAPRRSRRPRPRPPRTAPRAARARARPSTRTAATVASKYTRRPSASRPTPSVPTTEGSGGGPV